MCNYTNPDTHPLQEPKKKKKMRDILALVLVIAIFQMEVRAKLLLNGCFPK